MPGYRGHLVGAAIFFGIVLACVAHVCMPSLLTMMEWGACMLAGSLFPDIDIKSKGQRFFYLLLFVVFTTLIVIKRYKTLSLISVLALVPLIVHHRGLCHRVWFVVLVPLSIAFLIAQHMPLVRSAVLIDGAFFSCGALSHLWLDMGIKRMMRW